MIKVFRNIGGKYKDKFPNGREYLIDNETSEPAKFESVEVFLNLLKSEGHDITTEQDLKNWGLNIESVDE